MTIMVKNTATAAAFQTASMSVPVPSGTANGDYLVMAATNGDATPYNNPAGWTLIDSSSYGLGVWVRRASSEPSSYTVTTTANNPCQCGTMYALSGVAGVRSSAQGPIGGGNTSPAPGVLGVLNGDMTIIFYGIGGGFEGTNYTINSPSYYDASWIPDHIQIEIGTHEVEFNAALISTHKLNGTDTPTSYASGSAFAYRQLWTIESVALAAAGGGSFLPFFS